MAAKVLVRYNFPHHSASSRLRRGGSGRALSEAGECMSRAACCLPNWYSSKEGLSGESPAVFGGAGTAFAQAGESLRHRQFGGCASDLLSAACALEPVDLHVSVEEAAVCLELAAAAMEVEGGGGGGEGHVSGAATALEVVARQMEEYGEALDAEEQSSHGDRETAGGFLARAGSELRTASRSLQADGLA